MNVVKMIKNMLKANNIGAAETIGMLASSGNFTNINRVKAKKK